MRLPRSAVLRSLAMMAPARIELLTFDCTGTLFEPAIPLGVLYKQAVVAQALDDAKLVAAAEALSEIELTSAFGKAYAAADRARPCFGAGVCDSEEWWRPVVDETILTAAAQSFEESDLLEGLLPGIFDRLYPTFATRDAWQLTPHALETLETLRGWADGPKLGVISNWDERLHTVLEQLEVADRFAFVLTSREFGEEKPDARIFERARELAGVGAGSRSVHVGDSFKRDIVGARQSGDGWQAVFVCSEAERRRVSAVELQAIEHTHLESLATLVDVLKGDSLVTERDRKQQ